MICPYLIRVDEAHRLPIFKIGRYYLSEVCYENVIRETMLLHRQFLSKIN
jgi:hypothetical protein